MTSGTARSTTIGESPLMPMCRQTWLVFGVPGLSELSTINRAIGLLSGHGHHPDHAGVILRCHASIEGLEPHSYAARLLGR